MKVIFVVVGAVVGLLVVRGFMLDPIEEMGWRMFWDAFFKGDIGSDGMGTVFKSATFAKSAMGIAVGCVLGFLAATKLASTNSSK